MVKAIDFHWHLIFALFFFVNSTFNHIIWLRYPLCASLYLSMFGPFRTKTHICRLVSKASLHVTRIAHSVPCCPHCAPCTHHFPLGALGCSCQQQIATHVFSCLLCTALLFLLAALCVTMLAAFYCMWQPSFLLLPRMAALSAAHSAVATFHYFSVCLSVCVCVFVYVGALPLSACVFPFAATSNFPCKFEFD